MKRVEKFGQLVRRGREVDTVLPAGSSIITGNDL